MQRGLSFGVAKHLANVMILSGWRTRGTKVGRRDKLERDDADHDMLERDARRM